MTTISDKNRNKIFIALTGMKNTDKITAVLCVLTGVLSARSSWCDIGCASVGLILAAASRDILYRYCILSGALISVGVMALGNTAYIPLFLGIVVYAAGNIAIKKDSHCLLIAVSLQALAKIILVYHTLPVYYKLLAVTEAAAVYILVQIVRSGAESWGQSKDLYCFADVAGCFVALLCVAIALSGGDSHWIYPGFAVAMAVMWHSIAYSRLTVGFVAFVTAVVCLADKKGFEVLVLSAVLLWLVGGYFAERLSLIIYPAVLTVATVLNLVFISQTNSFALSGSCVLALITYFMLPYISNFEPRTEVPSLTAGRDWRMLILSLKKLENTMAFLGNCVVDISRLNEKNLKTDNLEDMVAEEVCRRCENNTVCWQQKYSFTQQQFTEYGQRMYWQEENRFSTAFCSQCGKTSQLAKSFEENSRLLLSKKYILQSQKNNQRLLQKAFVSVSSVVSELVYKNQHSYLINTTLTMETDRFLKDMDIEHTYCLCSQNPDQLIFAVYRPLEEKQMYKIKSFAEKIFGVKFSYPAVENDGSELMYIFTSKPVFDYDWAVKTNRYKRVNGDTYDVFAYNGCVYVLLSDGMGTGNLAAAESQTVIAMARSLITTGVSMKTVIDLINLSMNLKGSGETSASLDMLCVDLLTGQCTITKAGAGVSVVISENGVSRHYADSLPLGIVKEVKAVECQFTAKAGDSILLMSDGVGVISQEIKNMYGKSCGRTAERVLNQNSTEDDKTVVVLKLKLAI